MKVPLYKQPDKLSCGPTALRMVLAYFGEQITEKVIIKKIGGLESRGVRTTKLAYFVRKLGYQTECYSFNEKMAKGKAVIKKPQKKDIIKFLKKDIPVILAVRSMLLPNRKSSEYGHFIVVTKYQNGVFSYNDPRDSKRHTIKEEDLLFAWHNNILDSSAYFLALWKD